MRSHLEKTKKDVAKAHLNKFGKLGEDKLKIDLELPKIKSINEIPLESTINMKPHEFHLPNKLQNGIIVYI